jgi:hypothetical protein
MHNHLVEPRVKGRKVTSHTTKVAEFNRSVQHNISVWASPDVLDAFDVQTTVNLLQQCIIQSAEEVFGNRQVALGKAIKHSHKPWFNTECC